jgi:hypothetical protein
MPDAGPATGVAIAIHPSLRGSLAELGQGRNLVIGFFASVRCGPPIGDLTVAWQTPEPGTGFERLAQLEGVPTWADERLLGVLASAAPELRPGGVFSRGTPSLFLGFPERWIDFLDSPAAVAHLRHASRPGGATDLVAARPGRS